jgi:hypothetical protein
MQELAAFSFHGGPSRRTPLPMASVARTNFDFQLEIAPADGVRLPMGESGDFGRSPFFGQLSVKETCSTARKRTTLVL